MKKKNNHMTGNYITAIFVFICAVAASLSVFLVEVQRSIDQNSQVTMANNVSRQSDHILSILDIHYGFLNGIADKIGKSEDLLSDENMDMLVSICDNTDFERTALIEADGTSHYDNGAVKNVAERLYFKEAIRGKETLSDPVGEQCGSGNQSDFECSGLPEWKGGSSTRWFLQCNCIKPYAV